MVLHRENLEKLSGLGSVVLLCYITLKSSKGPCIKDHPPGVGDIVPNKQQQKQKHAQVLSIPSALTGMGY